MRDRCCRNSAAATFCTSVSQLSEQFPSRVSGSGVHQIALNSANVEICEHRRHPVHPIFGSGLGRSNRFRLSDQDSSKARSQKHEEKALGFGPIGHVDESVGLRSAPNGPWLWHTVGGV